MKISLGLITSGTKLDLNQAILVAIPDHVLAKVQVFNALGGNRSGPVDGSLVVIVDGGAIISVGHTKVARTVLDGHRFGDAFVSCHDMGFARAEGSVLLTNGLPCD